jgi:hypothetical protein
MARRRFRWSIAAILAISPAFAPAADVPPELRAAPQSTPAPAELPVLAPPDATCMEWTDGCRTCRKPLVGETACSNIGIACQPQALRCVHQPEK